MLSIKNLVFKERLVKKLIDWYISLYFIWWGNIYQCSQTMTIQFNENSSGSEC